MSEPMPWDDLSVIDQSIYGVLPPYLREPVLEAIEEGYFDGEITAERVGWYLDGFTDAMDRGE